MSKRKNITVWQPKVVTTPIKQVTTTQMELRFTPMAWSKLLFMRGRTSNEVSMMGISSKDDMLLIQDVALIKQSVGAASVEFDDDAVADFFTEQGSLGRTPKEFFRVWIHTHPGFSASPSGTDENTFRDVFGECDWAVMCIVGQSGGDVFCRVRLTTSANQTFSMEVPVSVAWEHQLPSSIEIWQKQYDTLVSFKTYAAWSGGKGGFGAWGRVYDVKSGRYVTRKEYKKIHGHDHPSVDSFYDDDGYTGDTPPATAILQEDDDFFDDADFVLCPATNTYVSFDAYFTLMGDYHPKDPKIGPAIIRKD